MNRNILLNNIEEHLNAVKKLAPKTIKKLKKTITPEFNAFVQEQVRIQTGIETEPNIKTIGTFLQNKLDAKNTNIARLIADQNWNKNSYLSYYTRFIYKLKIGTTSRLENGAAKPPEKIFSDPNISL